MKTVLMTTLILLSAATTQALDVSKRGPASLGLCPTASEELLEVTTFMPSADSGSNSGICYVKANYYSWWDLSAAEGPLEVELNAGVCDSDSFMSHNNKQLIQATVSYRASTSICESILGCHYECSPIVELWSF